MKRFYISFLVLVGAIIASSMITSGVVYAQKGEWIAYPFQSLGTGSIYAACGEECIGYVRGNSSLVLFFDIKRSEWVELHFGAQQSFHDLVADGHTVFAYSDEFLIGYSALKGQYDTVRYIGTPLDPDGYPDINRSYGCGKNLVFFVTDERMYVFDAALGYWQEYEYGLPPDYEAAQYIVKDDYIGIFLHRGFYDQPKNVVYSLHTHSFNQLEYGCYKPYAILDHGFARWHQHGGSGENYQITGYSAYTNEFDVIQVSDQGYLCFSNVEASGLVADEITAYAVSFRQVIEPYVLVRGDFYGYDTRLGSWSHTTIDFDHQVERYYGSWQHGGQFVVDMAIYNETEAYHFIIYSGLTGLFRTMKPGLIYGSATSFTRCGGTVFVVVDSLTGSAWGYDLITELGSIISIDRERTRTFPVSADDYVTFARYSVDSDSMTVYFYNSTTRNWTTTQMPKTISSGSESYNEDIYVFTSYDSPSRETIFYSSIVDNFVKRQFPVDSYVNIRVNGALAYADSNEKSYLFDAQTGTMHEFDLQFNQNGIGGVLGDCSASFYDKETKTLYGYSTLSRQWTTLTITDTPYSRTNRGFIGLISNDTGTQYYTKYYAYNGLSDSWVELVPTGSYGGSIMGHKTALVMRSNTLYAFDPELDFCEGDFNGDGDVDGSDLALFAADFGRTDCTSGPPCEGDFDNDGDVDGSDLALFAADFGRTDCP